MGMIVVVANSTNTGTLTMPVMIANEEARGVMLKLIMTDTCLDVFSLNHNILMSR